METIPMYDFETNWTRLRNQVPLFVRDSWQSILDDICLGWRFGKESYQEVAEKLDLSLSLQHLPELEFKQVSEYKRILDRSYRDFFKIIAIICEGEKVNWKSVKTMARCSQEMIGVGREENEQAAALLFAINETHFEGRDVREIRQKIAQRVFKKIFEVGRLRTFEWTSAKEGEKVSKRGTRMPFSVEKMELTSALRNPIWSENERKDMEKLYDSWKNIARSEGNRINPDVADSLISLWKLVNNKNTAKYSSLAILQLGENIYRELEDGGGFDVNLD